MKGQKRLIPHTPASVTPGLDTSASDASASDTSTSDTSGPQTTVPDEHRRAILNHEVGTVLNGLLGMAELLDRSGLNGEQRNWLDAIRDSGIQLQRLVESLGNVQSGAAGAAREDYALDGAALLEQLVRSHTPTALEKGNQLLMITDPLVPRRWPVDPCALRQLLDNLLSNAIRHTSGGVVVLEVSLPVAADTDRADLELCVTDSGCGIATADRAVIFEPYRQARASRETGGRGLGLYICERIVGALGGRISVESKRGSGSRFRVRLPALFGRNDLHQPVARSALFETLACVLALRGPMLRSVQALLTGLGIESREAGASAVRGSCAPEVLELLISESPGGFQGLAPRLLIERLQGGSEQYAPSPRFLTAPILPSTLAPALMAMALEWRQHLSPGNP